MLWALDERDKARSAEAAEVQAKAEALNSAKIAIEQTELAKEEATNARNQEKNARRLQQMADQRAVRAEKAERVAALREYCSKIQLAQTEWLYGDAALAVRTLRTSDWQLRGWEHDYLFTLFNKNHRTLIGQLAISYCVDFSPDSKQIVSGGQSGTVKIWGYRKRKGTIESSRSSRNHTQRSFLTGGKETCQY